MWTLELFSLLTCLWCLLQGVLSRAAILSAMNGHTCAFEGNLCDWEQSTKDDLQWTLQLGLTPTRRGGKILTGPKSDHTSHQGFYVYLETSQAYSGNYADLITKDVLNGPTDLEMWYYMFGLSMGSLEVLVWPSSVGYPGRNATAEWSMVGNKGDGWVKGTVHIRNNITPYKIIIRAKTGGRGTSDVAIDDVTLRTASSGVGGRDGGVTITTASTRAPVTVSNTLLYSCDMNFGSICNWTHPQNALMKWLVRTDSTPTAHTGANHDHTSGRGRFSYIETSSSAVSNLQTGSKAVILSPVVTAASSCPVYMSLYYNMYGKDIGSLQIRIYNVQQPVWSINGEQHTDGDTWTKAEFQLPDSVIGKTFQFEVVATRGNGPYGDICIDDFTVNQICIGGSVETSTENAPAAATAASATAAASATTATTMSSTPANLPESTIHTQTPTPPDVFTTDSVQAVAVSSTSGSSSGTSGDLDPASKTMTFPRNTSDNITTYITDT